MRNKATKIVNDSKKKGGKSLNLDKCQLTAFPKVVTSREFPNLLTLVLSNNSVRFMSLLKLFPKIIVLII